MTYNILEGGIQSKLAGSSGQDGCWNSQLAKTYRHVHEDVFEIQ